MDIDIAEHLGAVDRRVRSEERDGRPVRILAAERTYDTSVEDLWDAITRPERIPRWFTPVTGDLRPGGRFQLQGNAGGDIVHCEPPRHLSLTWEFGDTLSWVEVRLSPVPDGRARLELEHIAPDDDHWRAFGPGAGGIGWEMALMGLALNVGGAPPVDPQEAMEWMGSQEGHAFIRESSDGWGEAHAASGASPDEARAAAARTAAAYRGEEVTGGDGTGEQG
jgi:uncharacterized protein YndB with AHSA1/START domain